MKYEKNDILLLSRKNDSVSNVAQISIVIIRYRLEIKADY